MKVREAARGRWRSILPALGIAANYLSGRHGPCPICREGKDRWRFDDKEGGGTWFCSQCGAGDGVKLVMLVRGWDFPEAAREIEAVAGVSPVGPTVKAVDPKVARDQMNRLWLAGQPIS